MVDKYPYIKNKNLREQNLYNDYLKALKEYDNERSKLNDYLPPPPHFRGNISCMVQDNRKQDKPSKPNGNSQV